MPCPLGFLAGLASALAFVVAVALCAVALAHRSRVRGALDRDPFAGDRLDILNRYREAQN